GRALLRRPDELDVPARRRDRLRRRAVRTERVLLQESEREAHVRLRLFFLCLIKTVSLLFHESRAAGSGSSCFEPRRASLPGPRTASRVVVRCEPVPSSPPFAYTNNPTRRFR